MLHFQVDDFGLQFLYSHEPVRYFISPDELFLDFPLYLSKVFDLFLDFISNARADEVVDSKASVVLLSDLALHINKRPLAVLPFNAELPKRPAGFVLLPPGMSISDFSLCDFL